MTASEAEALVALGRRVDQIIWSEFRNEQWAAVESGDWRPECGEILIADFVRLGRSAHPHLDFIRDEPWLLRWEERRRRWQGFGISIGPGVPWWSEEVTGRLVVISTADRYCHDP